MEDKFLDKFDEEDRKLYKAIVLALSDVNYKERDEFLSYMFTYNLRYTKKLLDICEKLITWVSLLEDSSKKKELRKEIKTEIKEIENTLSIGIPGWIKFTRRNKKSK